MPPRTWPSRIRDILAAIEAIRTYTAGLSAEEFCANRMVQEAVVWNFTVMGEAVANIPEELRARHPQVPWRKMRDMRNFLAHVYFGISPLVVWETVQEDVVATAGLLRELLAAEGEEG